MQFRIIATDAAVLSRLSLRETNTFSITNCRLDRAGIVASLSRQSYCALVCDVAPPNLNWAEKLIRLLRETNPNVAVVAAVDQLHLRTRLLALIFGAAGMLCSPEAAGAEREILWAIFHRHRLNSVLARNCGCKEP
jgi:DNA-binding NarL/FixJ family response regulator